ASLRAGMLPHHLFTGWDDAGSPMSFMRFRWVAEEVNRSGDLHYELYRPWRDYDAVVFLKSMGKQCETKLTQLKERGTKTVFEANVDYYTEGPAQNLPGELAPTEEQRRTAIAMTGNADAVIASSTELARVCLGYARGVTDVSDNIVPSVVPSSNPPPCVQGGILHLWWSGMAAKLYDFLSVAGALGAHAKRLHLHLVTGDFTEAKRKWPAEISRNMDQLLSRVQHTFHRFRVIPGLLKLYSTHGGIIVSPRYLDSPYNRSHTEWKLTLGLACGLPGIGSPQPSYVKAAAFSQGALQICGDEHQWKEAIENILRDPEGARSRGISGRNAIMEAYGTPRVAARHAAVLRNLLA
ncbi:MAG: glycosyltransferase, partial [Chthoniobacterales bacterium]